ncbi:YceH family protein [Leptolyngbya sp. 7M]|uniref:YceH family protein n=1 Tax=Leptolyngbya sp. 7M TaxID=2812896 RepID=UPI001B8BC9FC|nr:YceH family protein [Leptolyngbya sp. 7M]QYO65777.1 YceH family protein [Leptolyngbya sp. 7M]
MINEIEARVLGSLVEKQLTTPEYYPLTLNSLTAACNQRSNRDPVMSLGETEVLAAIDSLRDKNLVYLFHGSTSRTVKYKHMLPSVLELEPEETAIITLLLLRGPQTVGELRGRSERLYDFRSLDEVQQTLDALARRSEPLVARLERSPGQKEPRYAHLFSGEPDVSKLANAETPRPSRDDTSAIDELRNEFLALKDELEKLKGEFAEFRKQFE